MLLRPLRTDDLPALTALEARAQPLPWSEDQLLLELVHDDAHVLGAFSGPRLRGYVALRKMVDELWVLNIAVDPDARRAGIARQLLTAALAHAHAHACTSLWLEVRESNAPARAVYGAMGLVEQGRRKIYYPPIPPATERETAVLMSRSV